MSAHRIALFGSKNPYDRLVLLFLFLLLFSLLGRGVTLCRETSRETSFRLLLLFEGDVPPAEEIFWEGLPITLLPADRVGSGKEEAELPDRKRSGAEDLSAEKSGSGGAEIGKIPTEPASPPGKIPSAKKEEKTPPSGFRVEAMATGRRLDGGFFIGGIRYLGANMTLTLTSEGKTYRAILLSLREEI